MTTTLLNSLRWMHLLNWVHPSNVTENIRLLSTRRIWSMWTQCASGLSLLQKIYYRYTMNKNLLMLAKWLLICDQYRNLLSGLNRTRVAWSNSTLALIDLQRTWTVFNAIQNTLTEQNNTMQLCVRNNDEGLFYTLIY